MLSDCRHPRFRNLISTVPGDVDRVKLYVDSLLNSTRGTSEGRQCPSLSTTHSVQMFCFVLLYLEKVYQKKKSFKIT